jgi:hypothetical protein
MGRAFAAIGGTEASPRTHLLVIGEGVVRFAAFVHELVPDELHDPHSLERVVDVLGGRPLEQGPLGVPLCAGEGVLPRLNGRCE